MKTNKAFKYLLLTLTLTLISFSGCQQNNGQVEVLKKIEFLETKVDSLEGKLADLKNKTRIVAMKGQSSPFLSPLQKFFIDSDMFWNSVTPVDGFECTLKCAKEFIEIAKSCKKPNGDYDQKCLSNLSKSRFDCDQDCLGKLGAF